MNYANTFIKDEPSFGTLEAALTVLFFFVSLFFFFSFSLFFFGGGGGGSGEGREGVFFLNLFFPLFAFQRVSVICMVSVTLS